MGHGIQIGITPSFLVDGNNGDKDWFRVLTSSGVSKSPNYTGSVKKFQLGCSNGVKGDF